MRNVKKSKWRTELALSLIENKGSCGYVSVTDCKQCFVEITNDEINEDACLYEVAEQCAKQYLAKYEPGLLLEVLL